MNTKVRFPLLSVVFLLTTIAFLNAGAQLQGRFPHPTARVHGRVDRKIVSLLHGTHPDAVNRAKIGARMNANTQLQHLVLVLQPSEEQAAALATLMDSQQDKTSPNYHKWLTPDTFGQSFGIAPSDISQVSSWLSDSGLAVENVSRSGRFITFSGSVGSVEAAFNTEIHHLTVDGEAHFSNISDTSVPSALAPVVKGVARLNNFFAKSGARDVRKVTLSPEYGTTASSTHYIGAADLATIYNAKPLTSAGIDGTGITIAVLARSNIQLGDVAAYRSFFGLPNNVPNVIVVGQDPGVNSDDIEASLDAELAGAIAPGAKIDFIVSSASLVGQGIDTAGLYAVDNNIGDIISLSYGGCEGSDGAGGTAFWNILWEEAAAQGQTVFVSTGDSGAAGCDNSGNSYATGGYGVNALGSSNFNVAVGGTMFVDYGPATYWINGGNTGIPYGTALTYVPEAAWNQGRLTTTNLNAAANGTTAGSGISSGGGGISIFTARPSWQTGSGISAVADPTASGGGSGIAAGSPITGLHRLVPDLSMIASSGHDGTLFCYEGICAEQPSGALASAGIIGGTSVATPAMASAQALIDAANGGRQGNANYYYYALANAQYTSSTTACQAPIGTAASPTVTAPASTCNFHDVVGGSNIVPTAALPSTAGIGFSSGTGFDEATGLGSVNIANMANNWHTVTFNSTTTTLTLTPQTGTHGSTMIAAIQVAAGSGTPTGNVSIIASSFTATGTPQVFTLSGGAVNGIVNSLPAGSYSVHAHYGGDSVFGSSDSAPVAVNISKEDSSVLSFQPYQVTSLGAVNSISSMVYGSGEFYLDTEFGATSGNGTPSGTVTYTVTRNGSSMPGLTTSLDTYGTTYLLAGPPFTTFFLLPNYATLPGGSYSVSAAYSGDTSFNGNTSTTTFTITPFTPTTATFTTGTATITSGASATLNYSIASAGASASLATGTVTFTDTTTSTVLGSATMVNGKAVFSTTAITTSGSHSISAAYGGDSNYTAPSTTPSPVTVTVSGQASTTIALTATTNPFVGTSVTLTGTPTAGSTGTVSFYDAGAFLGTGTISGTKATLPGQQFTAGTHSLTAIYSGDATHLTSTGSLALVVNKNATSMTIGGSETSTYGQLVEINGTMARSPSSTAVPAVPPVGLVNFYEGSTSGTLLGSAAPTFGVSGSAHTYNAVLSISTLTAGSHTIVAAFQGDANYAASTSPTAPLVVSKANQTITFTGLPATATFGAGAGPYTLSATATSGLPVSFTVSGPATLSGNVLSITGAGTVSVTASQPGDSNYNAATPVTQTIVIGTVSLSATAVLTKVAGSYQAVVTVKNGGTGTVSNVVLTVATFGSASGTPVPASFGNIPGGGSASVTLTFPSSAGSSGAGIAEKLTGTFTGGTFGGSFRAMLP